MDALINLLRQNARFSDSELATMLDTSEEDVRRRITRYEEEGVIKGYSVIVDEEKADKDTVSAIIELKVTPQPHTGFEEVAAAVMAYEEVEAVYLMSGAYDLALTVSGSGLKDIALFVAKRLSSIPGVVSTATHFVLKRYKEKGICIGETPEDMRTDLVAP